jgi:molecular chaperone DnaK (HSP70)
MGAIVGIDLGTTNTVVAAMRDGKPTAIRDETGSSLIPSIVSFLPSGAVLVGDAAKERRTDDTKNTVFSVKRLIGRPWDSPEVTQARQRFAFELKEGPGRATFVVARNETFTLPEISAYVLRKAKSIAETELGESVDRAIITVPANFNDLQRAATKVAGRVAGLDVLRILNEPTAAALAYGYSQGSSEKIAVFDFGGGTFDVTLLSLSENVFEVLATAGDTFLGGDDLDWAIVEKMVDAASSQLGRNVLGDAVALEQLRGAAEAIKISLTTSTQAELRIDLTPHSAGSNSRFTFAMSRVQFEQLAAPFIDKSFEVCRQALEIAHLEPEALDQVIAVGGSTRIPLVRQRAEEFFSRQLLAHLDPHEVVAIGAALQGYALTAPMASAKAEVPLPPEIRPRKNEVVSSEEWRKKTNPFGRLGTTNIGLGTALGPDKLEGILVPTPEGVPSRPEPNTRDLGSRDRRRTDMGLGSEAPPGDDWDWEETDSLAHGKAPLVHAADSFDPESLLPVVTATNEKTRSRAAFRAEVFSAPLTEADDDDATMVRAPAASNLGLDAELPAVAAALPSRSESVARALASPGAGPRESKLAAGDSPLPAVTNSRSMARQEEIDLPAKATPEAMASTSDYPARTGLEPDTQRLSKPPSTDELRQRYGDLPLIIGGKRLSSIPSGKSPLIPDLPLVRPALDTLQTTTPLPDVVAGRQQTSPNLREQFPTYSDSEIHAELPLVGVQVRPSPERTDGAQKPSSPRKPAPPRAAPNRTQLAPKAPSDDIPFSLPDGDVVEETRSLPPSAGRASIRAGMRMEPGEEDSLPLPDVPFKDSGHQSATIPDQVSPSHGHVPQSTLDSRRAEIQFQTRSGLESAKAPELGRPEPNTTTPYRIPEARTAGLADLGSTLRGTTTGIGGGPLPNRESRAKSSTSQSSPLVPAIAPAVRPYRDTVASTSSAAHYGIAVPLLIDVTPLSLSVETVGAYCDVLIDRNSPVPCERSREFVTVQDGQQSVRVRVAQGESRLFSENLLLGELELTGLRPAPRGQLRISVTFGLDSDGMLHVRAIDLDTGRATTSELRLAGIPSPAEVAQMTNRQMANS